MMSAEGSGSEGLPASSAAGQTVEICDNGSRDGTPAIVNGSCRNLPGALHHRPWNDFGHTARVLELAAHSADYCSRRRRHDSSGAGRSSP